MSGFSEQQLFAYSCCTVFLKRYHLIRRATDLSVVILFWFFGEKWMGDQVWPPAVPGAAVIILLFEEYLAWHFVFPLQAREIGTKASITVCHVASLLLWMYMSSFLLSWIALLDHCWVAFDTMLCLSVFMCIFFPAMCNHLKKSFRLFRHFFLCLSVHTWNHSHQPLNLLYI